MDDRTPAPLPLSAWKESLVADLHRVAVRDRWGLALMAVGWIHLGFFVVCQIVFSFGSRHELAYLALWSGELAANWWVVRRIAGKQWARTTPLAGVILRVWLTFLILSFNVASLNTLTGWSVDWFKPVWATLSTFGFATMAYLINPWFFVPAVQMYFTGLVMVLNPALNYLIYGVSWWAALQGLGLWLERRRLRQRSVDKQTRQHVEAVAA